jgi:hypothetical protein
MNGDVPIIKERFKRMEVPSVEEIQAKARSLHRPVVDIFEKLVSKFSSIEETVELDGELERTTRPKDGVPVTIDGHEVAKVSILKIEGVDSSEDPNEDITPWYDVIIYGDNQAEEVLFSLHAAFDQGGSLASVDIDSEARNSSGFTYETHELVEQAQIIIDRMLEDLNN